MTRCGLVPQPMLFNRFKSGEHLLERKVNQGPLGHFPFRSEWRGVLSIEANA